MPEPKIRYEIITVETTQKNQYGDLMVNGNLKVGNKRSHLFDVFQPGAEVKIGYASYMNKEYIASAEQTGVHKPLEEHLVKASKGADPVEIPPPSSQPKSSPIKETSDSKLPEKPTEEKTSKYTIERAVWIKELGECVRSSDIDKSTPEGKALRNAYYAEMIRVLGINIKEVKPTKSLIEEAKRLGAVEGGVEK